LQLEHESGLDVLKQILALRTATHVIMLTGYGTIETAVDAIKLGAFDFIQKPAPIDKLAQLVQNAIAINALPNASGNVFQALADFSTPIVTQNTGMLDLCERARTGDSTRSAGPDLRRKRHRQGIAGGFHSRPFCQSAGSVLKNQLCRVPGVTAGRETNDHDRRSLYGGHEQGPARPHARQTVLGGSLLSSQPGHILYSRHYAATVCRQDRIGAEHLPPNFFQKRDVRVEGGVREDVEKALILRTLKEVL
jgi:hypothetical protein